MAGLALGLAVAMFAAVFGGVAALGLVVGIAVAALLMVVITTLAIHGLFGVDIPRSALIGVLFVVIHLGIEFAFLKLMGRI